MVKEIRLANFSDIPEIEKLLYQVQKVHSDKRPDIFIKGAKKYNAEQLKEVIKNKLTPIYVAINEQNKLQGYAFCIIERKDCVNLQKIKTLYIDDLCVDENARGQGVGTALYNHVLAVAKSEGCYNLTLNVWELNQAAYNFYKKMGLTTLKRGLETII